MANWLLDYIEMTEYIPSELREQLTSIRELDLQVHNAMDELERDIKQFFSKIDTLSPQERQDQYDAFLKKCDVATRAASDKVKVADKLHDLVEKSMRLLDQGLEKLKEDLLEGDKAYIVEDLERRSQELDEQMRLEHESMLQRQSKLQELKTHSKNHKSSIANNNNIDSLSNHVNSQTATINHRHSLPAQASHNSHHPNHNSSNNNNHHHHHHHHHHQANHRNRHHSTSNVPTTVGRQKKHERKRQNSTMTTFNRNSCLDDNSSSQSFLQSPLTTPDYLAAMQNSNKTLNDVGGAISNNSLTTMKGMMAGNRNLAGIFDKINGNDPLAGAKQPILTAIDAAHAVSPNATNSDKLVLFSSNPNGDKSNQIQLNSAHNNNLSQLQQQQQQQQQTLSGSQNPYQLNHQLSNHLLSTVGYTSGDNTMNSSNTNNSLVMNAKNERHNHDPHQNPHYHSHHHLSGQPAGTPFSALPRHDPIMMAASQAINATQNMTPGRRTSSLKASYAAVNSGRLQTTTPNHQHHQSQQPFEQGGGLIAEVYCKCRSHIQGSNMIACDNSKCKIEWFHYECVGITTPPEGEWYCDDCRITLNIQKNHKQPKLEGVNVT